MEMLARTVNGGGSAAGNWRCACRMAGRAQQLGSWLSREREVLGVVGDRL